MKMPRDQLKRIRDRIACIRDDLRVIGNLAGGEFPSIREVDRDARKTAVEMIESGQAIVDIVRETGLAVGSVKAIEKEMRPKRAGRPPVVSTLAVVAAIQQTATYAEAGRQLGLSRERVRQVAKDARDAGVILKRSVVVKHTGGKG